MPKRTHNEFMQWFAKDSPNFTSGYGEISNFYDKESDSFLIDSIQTEYETFKRGEEPCSLYFSWSYVR